MNRFHLIRATSAHIFERNLLPLRYLRSGRKVLVNPPPFGILEDYYMDRTYDKVMDEDVS